MSVSDTEKRILNDFSEWCSVHGQWDVTDLDEALNAYLARPEPNEGEIWVVATDPFARFFAVLYRGRWIGPIGEQFDDLPVPLFKYENPEDLF